MIPLLRNPETLVRVTAGSLIVLSLLLVYRFSYVPNGRAVTANLEETTRLLNEVDQRQNVPVKYQLLRQALRRELDQKGIEEEDQWLVRSATDLQKQLLRILNENSAEIKQCTVDESPRESPTAAANRITIVFLCDLPQLFNILHEADQFPSNVKVNHFELNESPGPQLCRVQMDFQVDQSAPPKTEQPKEKAAL